MSDSKPQNWSVFIRTVIMTSLILAVFLTAVSFIVDHFLQGFSMAGSVESSGHLFVLWLVVSSAIRSINRLSGRIPGWTFLLAGLLVAAGGIFFQEGIVYLVELFKADLGLKALGFTSLPFYLAAGFLAALLALINIKIRSRFWAGLLEILIFAGIIFFFFYYMK